MPVIDEPVRANETYASTFDRGELPLAPARGLAILTCMDARLLPSRVRP
jgi:carbonic anhydrase